MPLVILLFVLGVARAVAAPLQDAQLQEYFTGEVERIERRMRAEVPKSLEEWRALQEKDRARLFEMLSLAPRPEKTPLNATITGRIETNGIVVENLHFQALPGLYVTANFYRPKEAVKPLPTILYLCGHGQVKTNGVSFGNKTMYQHHGAWFARHGYACLTLDTIQLGEIEGIHHGTHREEMWWWNSRGYTPAGVEAWNAIRALDYLETRREVDAARIGVTGRSGGGAYSWWIAALDERIKVAAPVAGITDLRDHVIAGVVEGHCDCMFFVNTEGWDYPRLAALVAPRPLLIANSDKDTIFPLEGVLRTHGFVREIYRLHGAADKLGLLITEGPHKDTQDLQLPTFRWFNRHLKGEDPVINTAATKFFRPDQLKVFGQLPGDERTSRIHETFVPAGGGAVSIDLLRAKVFGGWPEETPKLNLRATTLSIRNREFAELTFDSQPQVRLSMWVARSLRGDGPIRLVVADEGSRKDLAKLLNDSVDAVLLVRGVEAEKMTRTEIQIRRRYMLVGQTLDGMRVWDIRSGVRALQAWTGRREPAIEVMAEKRHASSVLLAALFEPSLAKVRVGSEVDERADYLNLLRHTSWEKVRAALEPRLAR